MNKFKRFGVSILSLGLVLFFFEIYCLFLFLLN